MNSIKPVNGWVAVPFSGPELLSVHLSFGQGPTGTPRYPAFLDYDVAGNRVAKCRVPRNQVDAVAIWLHINGTATRVGYLQP